jgi:hypothetical protein
LPGLVHSSWIYDGADERARAEEGITLHRFPQLAVSLERVQENFRRYGLLDEQVRFLKGWFRDTLPTAPIERLAVLRLDGDLYESTIQALDSLYDKLSVGGFVIVDDYGNVVACRQAVGDFRTKRGITDPIAGSRNSRVSIRESTATSRAATSLRLWPRPGPGLNSRLSVGATTDFNETFDELGPDLPL